MAGDAPAVSGVWRAACLPHVGSVTAVIFGVDLSPTRLAPSTPDSARVEVATKMRQRFWRAQDPSGLNSAYYSAAYIDSVTILLEQTYRRHSSHPTENLS